jgi:hypothetical protein
MEQQTLILLSSVEAILEVLAINKTNALSKSNIITQGWILAFREEWDILLQVDQYQHCELALFLAPYTIIKVWLLQQLLHHTVELIPQTRHHAKLQSVRNHLVQIQIQTQILRTGD